MRRTKILATLGPASCERTVLDGMIAAGLDAVRLNFSHGTHDWHAEALRLVREAASRAERPVAVLQDLRGPKVRIGVVKGQMSLSAGSRLVITTRPVEGENGVVSTDYEHLPKDVAPGARILLDEGRLTVEVRDVSQSEVVCEVIDGGVLSSYKGINLPGAALTAASLTDKDVSDLRFGLRLGVDFVALSMVRRAQDVQQLRAVMKGEGRVVPIVAKIEKPQAVAALAEIVHAAEGVMVARGDLGIEMALDMIPAHQKKIIECANRAGKLVITATQMLESMTDNLVPTRAEVTDVASAILDGTDAVMLSGETAVGRYPVETVRRMASIAEATEENLYPFERPVRDHAAVTDLPGVLARIAAEASRQSMARALVVFTIGGETARRLSDERPRAPIVAFAREEETRRQLALYWGVQPRPLAEAPADLVAHGTQALLSEGGVAPGEVIVFVLGSGMAPGAALSVKLARA